MELRAIILGAGGSTGVPAVGMGWGACDPKNPKNRRSRPSILVEDKNTRLLIDTSPDLREQLIRHNIERLNGILMTHGHADHLHGIDDIRGINRAMDAPIDLYADTATHNDIKTRFAYVLEPLDAMPENMPPFYYKPVLMPHIIAPGMDLQIGSIPIQVMDQDHGRTKTLGFRFGDIAYNTDVKELPESSFDVLDGIRTWIVGAPVMHPNHPTHIHLEGALEWIERVQPERAIITHLGLGIDFETIQKGLPDRVELAYDGMIIEA
ncbi:MAG: MBL fold metallo-hydrolase [Rhodospirillales bacterium]|nr:MBL fold metallo-hydrolase [Rhodospirillales bacterium]